jgi:hypothetical protein
VGAAFLDRHPRQAESHRHIVGCIDVVAEFRATP